MEDGTGATERVLLEGDAISYSDLTDKLALLQGEQGPPGADSTVPGPTRKDGISPEAPAFVSNPISLVTRILSIPVLNRS